jgi:putative tricarboxylic transport membrane protein
MSYGIEKAVSKHPEEFGEGAIEGVAAPEGANNAETGGALVPLLTLGIPGQRHDRRSCSRHSSSGASSPGRSSSRTARSSSGACREHVHRQRAAAHPQPAARRRFAQLLKMPGVRDVPAHPRRLDGRGLHRCGSMFQLGCCVASGLMGYLMRKLDYPTARSVSARAGRCDGAGAAPVAHDVPGDISILFRPIPSVLLAIAALLLAVPLFKRFNAVARR